MSRITVVLTVFVLLAMAQAGQAADLQAGWYANIYTVNVYVYDYQGIPQLATGAYFYDTPPDDYGPFHISGGDPRYDGRRYISVPSGAQNVGPEQNVVLPLSIPLGNDSQFAYLSFAWQTNYDSSQMYIDLWRTRANGTTEQVWTQRQGGLQFDTTHVAFDTTFEGPYFFRVNVVPEPTSFLALLIGITGLALARRRS